MTKEKLPKATHGGNLNIKGFNIECYNLDTGERVLSRIGFLKALGRTGKAKGGRKYDEEFQTPVFLTASNIKPLLNEELIENSKPIIFNDLKGNQIIGYKAALLPQVANVFSKAYLRNNLKSSQIHIGEQSEILVDALLNTSIIALVDEATGYQYEREKDELQKILAAYISKELLPWQKRFPDEFYKEIFRLNGWDFTVKGINQRPGVIGKWTNSLIYRQLPKGVLAELRNKTPKNETGKLTKKLHQSLTSDIGHPHLEKQLTSVVTLMNISKDWKEFMKYFNKKFGQQELDFGDSEIEKKPKENKSNFDKTLGAIMKVPKK